MSGQMQVTETLSEGLKRGFTVVVPANDIAKKQNEKLSQLGRNLSLPGFRPGKVPQNVVRQRYGAAVMAEVNDDSIDDAVRTVLQDRGLRAATQPQIEVVRADAQKDLEFKLVVELLPEIPVPDLASVALTRLKATPRPEAIDKTLTEIAQRQRALQPIEEARGAEKGEVLTVNFVGKVDDVAFPGGTGNDVNLEVAGPGFIPGFTEQVEGMKVGDSRSINVTFPEDYGTRDLAGKAAVFDITATKLQKPVPAEIDEELAKKLGFDDLGKLREVIQEQMQREYDGLSRMKVKRQLLDALAGLTHFDAPESMVKTEFDAIWRRVESDMKADKLDDEDKGKDEATLRGEYQAIAERRVRLGLLLSEIGRVNGIQVSQDEMTRAMRAEAARYRGQEREVIEFFRKNPQAAETLRGPLLEEKVVDFILDQAKVEEKETSPEELADDSEAVAA